MIVEEHVAAFINSLNAEASLLILELEREAHEHHVPIIRPETRELLCFLLRLHRPERILEIGTAIGYSSIIMRQALEGDVKIDTIERNMGRYERAVDNIKRAGLQEDIKVHYGDAFDVLATLDKSYDFIFMDAAKGQYHHFLELCIDKLSKNGMLVCDNVLQEGSVAQSRYAVSRRDHTVHGRMREYLYEMKHSTCLDTVILPVGDGVTVSRKC